MLLVFWEEKLNIIPFFKDHHKHFNNKIKMKEKQKLSRSLEGLSLNILRCLLKRLAQAGAQFWTKYMFFLTNVCDK